jgi:hypothetical protein
VCGEQEIFLSPYLTSPYFILFDKNIFLKKVTLLMFMGKPLAIVKPLLYQRIHTGEEPLR